MIGLTLFCQPANITNRARREAREAQAGLDGEIGDMDIVDDRPGKAVPLSWIFAFPDFRWLSQGISLEPACVFFSGSFGTGKTGAKILSCVLQESQCLRLAADQPANPAPARRVRRLDHHLAHHVSDGPQRSAAHRRDNGDSLGDEVKITLLATCSDESVIPREIETLLDKDGHRLWRGRLGCV